MWTGWRISFRAIDNAGKHTAIDEEQFLHHDLVQVWVLHHLLIIGEAARGISEKLRAEHPKTRGRRSSDRNAVVHEYFGLNLKQVWMVLVRDLPVLRVEVEAILKSLQRPG